MAACTSPLRLGAFGPGGKRYSGVGHSVPCGKCIACRLNHSREWSIRIHHEAKQHLANSFLTLTYSEAALPIDGGLSKLEFQLFMKRLRRRLEPSQLRFFGCGEYGERGNRPHYHLILFGADFRADRKEYAPSKSGAMLYTSALLDDVWGLGACFIGDVTPGSAGYVARYNMKKVATYNRGFRYQHINVVTGEVYQVEEEFLLMSRRPGIGSGWWDRFKSDAFPSDFIVIDGKRLPVPRYYRSKYNGEVYGPPPPAGELSKRSAPQDLRRAQMGTKQLSERTVERRAVRDESLHIRAAIKGRDFDGS